MTPNIHLEFKLNVKAGPQTHGRRVPAEELRRQRGSGSSARSQHLRSEHRHAVRIRHRAAPGASGYHGSLPCHRPRRYTQPPAHFRVPPQRARRRDSVRPQDFVEPGSPGVSPRSRRQRYRVFAELLSAGAQQNAGASKPESKSPCAASWPTRNLSSASNRRPPTFAPNGNHIESAIRNWLRACRFSYGPASPTTSC